MEPDRQEETEVTERKLDKSGLSPSAFIRLRRDKRNIEIEHASADEYYQGVGG